MPIFIYKHAQPSLDSRTEIRFDSDEAGLHEQLLALLPESDVPYDEEKLPYIVLIGIVKRQRVFRLLRGELQERPLNPELHTKRIEKVPDNPCL